MRHFLRLYTIFYLFHSFLLSSCSISTLVFSLTCCFFFRHCLLFLFFFLLFYYDKSEKSRGTFSRLVLTKYVRESIEKDFCRLKVTCNVCCWNFYLCRLFRLLFVCFCDFKRNSDFVSVHTLNLLFIL